MSLLFSNRLTFGVLFLVKLHILPQNIVAGSSNVIRVSTHPDLLFAKVKLRPEQEPFVPSCGFSLHVTSLENVNINKPKQEDRRLKMLHCSVSWTTERLTHPPHPPCNLNFQAAGCSLLIVSRPEAENTVVSFMSQFGAAGAHMMVKTLQPHKLQGAEREEGPPWCLIGPAAGLSAVIQGADYNQKGSG